MAGTKAFNSVVAARTRAAQQILASPDLLAGYLDLGGLTSDLETVRDQGLLAEAANLDQSGSQAGGKAATADVLASFAALQKEYAKIMAVVEVVTHDLEDAAAAPDLVAALQKILVNEAETTVKVSVDASGAKTRAVRRSVSQEALRAEIGKDAAALLALADAAAPLAERKVSAARLGRLRDDADALSGKLSGRAAKKGASRDATKLESAAVAAQRKRWGACYRLLAQLGHGDSRVAALLKEAAR